MARTRCGLPVLLTAFLVVAGIPLLLGACSSGDQTLNALEPGIVPASPDYDQVSAIMERACVPCHKGRSEDDIEHPDLDTCEGIQLNLSRVVESIHEETMPIGAWPRLDEHEKLLIDRWFLNGACSPCSEPCPEVGS